MRLFSMLALTAALGALAIVGSGDTDAAAPAAQNQLPTTTATQPATPLPTATPPLWETIQAACASDNPYFVTAAFLGGMSPLYPRLLAFRDTAGLPASGCASLWCHWMLGGGSELPKVHGLAYDALRGHLYAGGYYEGEDLGWTTIDPNQIGSIYRLDMHTGKTSAWASLDAGAPSSEQDYGKVGLGDLEVSHDVTELFAVNLYDRRIHRFALPDGAVLGSFDHGAARMDWAADARPFGLGFHDGWLYHGVVNSLEGMPSGTPEAYVYRSRADGSEMTLVLTIDLGYRTELPWRPWSPIPFGEHGQPLLSDIEFRPNGDLIIGFRDRGWEPDFTSRGGDVLPTERTGPAEWRVVGPPDFYVDAYGDRYYPENTQGALAVPPGEDRIVTLSVLHDGHSGGAVWYSNASGAIEGPADGIEWLYGEEPYGGDIESLCPETPPTPTPTHTPSATPSPPVTPIPSPTSTATPTATPTRFTIYLPFGSSYHCLRPRAADVTLVIDVSTSMRRDGGAGRSKLAAVQAAARAFVDRMNLRPGHPASNRVALVAFNRTAWTEQELTDNAAALGAALDRLPAAVEEYTRLDLALAEGGRALSDAGEGTSDRERVLVLLTDGLPNGVPLDPDSGTMEGAVLRAAEAVKRTGVRVYTIGVGRPDAPDPVDRINRELLRAVATSPDMAYEAADAEAVAGIYEEIALRLACR